MIPMQLETVDVDGQRTTVFRANVATGTPVLLIHGVWAGARAHWEPVWNGLAQHHPLVAPQLSGVASGEAWTVAEHADDLAALLDVLELRQVVAVGNSLGAAVVWALAHRHPERVKAVVLVNGGPFPAWSKMMAFVLSTRVGRAVLTAMFRLNVFGPSTARRAFADPAHVPSDIQATLTARCPNRLSHMTQAYAVGDGDSKPPTQPTLLLWGQVDKLVPPTVARHVLNDLPNGQLTEVPDAGHLPQVEQPIVFVHEVTRFLSTL